MTKSLTECITICFLCSEIPSETSGFGPRKGGGVGGGGVNGLNTSTFLFFDSEQRHGDSREIKHSSATRNQAK